MLAAAVDRTWHQLTASLETIVAEAGVAASGADADAAAVDTSVTRLLGGYGDGTTDAAAGSEGQDEDDEDDEDQPTPDPSEVEFQSALDARREAARKHDLFLLNPCGASTPAACKRYFTLQERVQRYYPYLTLPLPLSLPTLTPPPLPLPLPLSLSLTLTLTNPN